MTGGSDYIDQWIRPPGPFPVIDIASQPLAEGMTKEEFLAWLDEENSKICSVESTEAYEVDGVEARLQRQSCGYGAYEVAAIEGNNVYLIYWLGGSERDLESFQQILGTFRFP
jgi:hypothetical protein